ncbi:hypothetical protein [Ulvibacterium sp.]|uniref:hypothetical protein n=1 Tax=Ulvibacterium sp. TaxID=2665914 RepID=UPI002638DAA4|nr:hypothetical protein [Ulvibacterium sp.]
MKSKGSIAIGLILIITSQLLMSFGYEFLMSQQPIDYAHWALLIGAILMFGLWFHLPSNFSKNIGLTLMTFGIGGIVGMCVLDFILWASHSDPETKGKLFEIISNTPSIQYSFLIIGPALFYTGICVSTYGLFMNLKWQVIIVNIGALMIGLGHMVLHNGTIPVVGAVLLCIGLFSILGILLPKKE